MRCIQGIAALSYFFDRYIGRLSSTEKIPVGVGFSSFPLEIVEAATSVSSAIEIGDLVREADDNALGPVTRNVAPFVLTRFECLRPEGVEHVDLRLEAASLASICAS